MTRAARVCVLALLAAGGACSRDAGAPSPAPGPATLPPAGKLPPAAVGSPSAKGAAAAAGGAEAAAAAGGGAAVGAGTGAASAGASAGAGKGEPSVDDEDLKAEDEEDDPRSEKVTLKLSVDPPVRGIQVMWGRKNLGKPPLLLERARNSGPMDLVIRAPGYLPFHTRAFTDRDDKLHVRLVTEKEAPHMLGYKRPDAESEGAASAAAKPGTAPGAPKPSGASVAKPVAPGTPKPGGAAGASRPGAAAARKPSP